MKVVSYQQTSASLLIGLSEGNQPEQIYAYPLSMDIPEFGSELDPPEDAVSSIPEPSETAPLSPEPRYLEPDYSALGESIVDEGE
jgi:hypothetical protein